MGYKTLKLTEIALPEDSEIKKNTEWRYERAYGVGLYIQHIESESFMPVIVNREDQMPGMKYGVWMQTPGYLSKDKRFYTEGWAGVASNIHRKLMSIGESDYTVEALSDIIGEKLGVTFFDETHSFFNYQDDKIICIWTTDREQYPQMLEIVSAAIENAAQLIYKEDRDDGMPVLDEAKKSRLKKPKIYMCNDEIYDTLEEMYTDVSNTVLPKTLSEGVVQAMKVCSGEEIACRLDGDEGKMVFYQDNNKPFFIFPCDLLGRVHRWCFALKRNQGQEATHWLSDAMVIADNAGAFKAIKHICVIGEYYGDGDMDVVFEK